MTASRLAAAAIALAACKPDAPAHPIENAGSATTLAEQLDRAKHDHGDVLLVSRPDGIAAYAPDLTIVAKLTSTPGSVLRADPAAHALYYFAERRLVRLDLASGAEHTVATLPELHHACFSDPDPVRYVQRDEDVLIDTARGFACVQIQDRNTNMMSAAITYRVALDGGAIQQATTFTLDECREPGELPDTKAPCEAGDLITGPEPLSPSKRWELVRDPDLGEQGDYIYSATLLADKRTAKTYAITPTRLTELDVAAARAAHTRPEGTCVLPYEATVRWWPHADATLITGCAPDGALVVRPPASIGAIAGDAFGFY